MFAVLNDLPPQGRDIAMTFQKLCAYPAYGALRKHCLRVGTAKSSKIERIAARGKWAGHIAN